MFLHSIVAVIWAKVKDIEIEDSEDCENLSISLTFLSMNKYAKLPVVKTDG